jgi:hypothetical protein
MSEDDPVKGRRAPQWLPTAGIALATPFLVWFAIGESPTYASYRFGPYEVGPESGYVVGGMAAIVAVAAVAVLVIRTLRGVVGRSWAVVVPLAMAGALGAAGWRLCTASYSGADIGGPVVMEPAHRN